MIDARLNFLGTLRVGENEVKGSLKTLLAGARYVSNDPKDPSASHLHFHSRRIIACAAKGWRKRALFQPRTNVLSHSKEVVAENAIRVLIALDGPLLDCTT